MTGRAVSSLSLSNLTLFPVADLRATYAGDEVPAVAGNDAAPGIEEIADVENGHLRNNEGGGMRVTFKVYISPYNPSHDIFFCSSFSLFDNVRCHWMCIGLRY